MKILYGVQGTGNGHIARARIMAEAFAARSDVTVDFVFSGRAPDKYFDMQVFGNYRCLEGLSFVSENGQVNRFKTIKNASLRNLFRDIRQFKTESYDLLINDFEPVTAWAAKCNKLPSISISHQASFAYAVPKAGDSLLNRTLIKYFAPTDLQLGVHWYHFNQPILPPFISPRLQPEVGGNHILVYLPFEHIKDIHEMLDPISEQLFICFHPEISAHVKRGHIHWYPTSKDSFETHLKQANGVIANGGFELSSEALQLGKKLLIKPLHGQFEQLSNVVTLDKLGLCQPLFQLSTDGVEDWLELPDNEAVQFPQNPQILIDWIVKKKWNDTSSLCNALWKEVKFGDRTKEKLLSLAF